jgi:hypothetical protein
VISKPNRFQIEDERQRMLLQKFIQARPLPFQCEVGPIREQRTLPQNALLWKCHQLAAEATGMSADELHEFMLCKFWGYEEKEFAGVVRRIPRKRSSVREKGEFSEFLEFVQSFYASELGLWVGTEE